MAPALADTQSLGREPEPNRRVPDLVDHDMIYGIGKLGVPDAEAVPRGVV
jgi:hypothetical protein